jgi:hypothetical protein
MSDKLNAHITATTAADTQRLLKSTQRDMHIDARDARRHSELNTSSRSRSRTHKRHPDNDVASISSCVSSKKQHATYDNPVFELGKPPPPSHWLPTPHIHNAVLPPPPPLMLSAFQSTPQDTPAWHHDLRPSPKKGKRKSASRSSPPSPPSESSSSSDDYNNRRNGPRRQGSPPAPGSNWYHNSTRDFDNNIVTYQLQEKAEQLLSHIPTYDGHEGSSGIKFISMADEYMHNNQETCHRMITAVTSRFTPDSVAAHWYEAHVMASVRSY